MDGGPYAPESRLRIEIVLQRTLCHPMNLDRLKVSTRLTLGFGAATLLGMAIAVTGALKTRTLASELDMMANDRLPKVEKLQALTDNFNNTGRYARNIMIHPDAAFRQAEKTRIAETRAANAKVMEELDKVLHVPHARELFKEIGEKRKAYNQLLDKGIAAAEGGADGKALGTFIVDELRPQQAALFKAVDELQTLQATLAKDTAAEGLAHANASAVLLLTLAVALGAIGAALGWLITRSLSRALGAEPYEVSAAAQRVADGDLATPVHTRAGDTRSAMATVQRMQGALGQMVRSVRSNAESVATASAQIAQGNQDLSQRTEEQASALQQTSATMTELSTTVRSNSDSARQASQLAMGASSAADKGGEVVGSVVQTMKGIQDGSRKIADIIAVIDGIAFQTNILALNAAVEAARAGEQGRGFAVVAGEVRSLAQRSAEAAKEIKTLITRSVEQVEQGTTLVDEAGRSMGEIVSSIKRVSDIVSEISAASTEQSTGVGQVETAINQMDQATQQNAALVEESAAAAASLRGQADQLVKAMAAFKLSGDAGPVRAVAPAKAEPRKAAAAAPRAAAASKPSPSKPVAAKPAVKPAVNPAANPTARAEPRPQPKAATPVAAGGDDDWTSF